MKPISKELKEQIETAFDYRGHVTIRFKDGSSLEGFLFNRIYRTEKVPDGNYVEVFPKDREERLRLPMESILAIELTGKDCAESYSDFLKRTGGRS